MFIDTRTYVILNDELLLTFFYQLLWLFYPFYWSCLIVCSSGFVWWFMRLIFSSLRSSCCNIHLLNKLILLFSSYAGSTRWFPRLFVHHYLKYLTIGQYGCFFVSSLVMCFFLWLFGYLFFIFFISVIWFIWLFSMSTGCMFSGSNIQSTCSFNICRLYVLIMCCVIFLFVHCFNCLLPLSAAVSGSSLRLFQCLVLFEFSLPLFALSIRSVILFSFSFVCLFRKF